MDDLCTFHYHFYYCLFQDFIANYYCTTTNKHTNTKAERYLSVTTLHISSRVFQVHLIYSFFLFLQGPHTFWSFIFYPSLLVTSPTESQSFYPLFLSVTILLVVSLALTKVLHNHKSGPKCRVEGYLHQSLRRGVFLHVAHSRTINSKCTFTLIHVMV